MFTISNVRKLGDNSFVTAKGKPVIIRPGRTLQFEDDELNDGLLRTFVGEKSPYRVIADTAEAQDLIDAAKVRKPKKNGSPLVHGSTEPPNYQAGRDKPIEIRDQKEEAEKHPPVVKEPEVTKAFIKEEDKTPLPPAEKLLAVALDKPYTELVAEAREVLGESFPEGRPGRKAIVEALTIKIEADKKPQE